MNEKRTKENSKRDASDWKQNGRSNEHNLNQVEAFSIYGSTYFQDWQMTAHNGITDVSTSPLLGFSTPITMYPIYVPTVRMYQKLFSKYGICEIGKDLTLRVRTGLGKRPQIRSIVPEKGSVWNSGLDYNKQI